MTTNTPIDKDVDLTNISRGIWLVKVPKYIANKWNKAPGNIEVGKLRVAKISGQKPKISLALSESVLCLKDPSEDAIPKDHRLDISAIQRQSLAVFSQQAANADTAEANDKLFMEGKVVQKLECRPYADNCYMKLKKESIRKASLPTRQVQQLDRIVNTYKPVSDHKNNIEYNERKKAEGKKARDDKDAVLEMLFSAFEKHQYYNIKDLVKLTRQPVTYLKDILKEVCNYNLKNPHRNMWELKPEYRHYKEKTNDEEKMDADD